MSQARAIARRTLGDSRTRTIAFALLFFYGSAAQVLTYRSTYPTLQERLELARTFGANKGLWLLYGVPHDLLHVGGWAAWRLGAFTVFAGLWGLLGAVRALRAEEDSGRQELLLAAPLARRTAFWASLAGVGIGASLLWACLFAGVALGGAGLAGSAYLALALVSPLPVFVGVGALASQIAPARRVATAIAGGVLAAALLLRMVADTAPGAGWLRWATPLGWAEEMHAFTGAQPLVLALPVVATTAALVAAARIAERRDIGTGLLAARDTAPPRFALLASPTALALRTVRGGLIAWLIGVAVFAVILGGIADSVASDLSEALQEQFAKFGTAANTATSFLGLEFLFVVFALSLFVCFQLGTVREDEAEQRLETLLVLPLSRGRWLGGRMALVAGAVAVLALAAGVLSWAGAVSQGADVSFTLMLEASANCLPAALLFLGLGALALALAPRAGVAIAYVFVGASFLLEAIGGLIGIPGWLLAISPFHHVAPVPAESLQVRAAAGMLALAAVAATAALRVFERRDLAGA